MLDKDCQHRSGSLWTDTITESAAEENPGTDVGMFEIV